MNDQSYTTSVWVDRSPAEVFDAVNDVRAWWTQEARGDTTRVGAEWDYRVRDIHTAKMRVTELVPGRRVVWRVLENYLNFVEDQSEWVGTEIRFELVEQDGGTRIDFTHDGLLPEFECYEVCNPAWTFYLRTSLPQLLSTGTGLPEQDPGLVEPVVAVAG